MGVLLKVALPTIIALSLTLVAAGEIDITKQISLGTLIVSAVVAVGMAYAQIKSKTGEVYQKERDAWKERSDRLADDVRALQKDKDEIGAHLVECQVAVARLEERPNLTQLAMMLQTVMNTMETQAHAGHEIGQRLLEALHTHDERAVEIHGMLVELLRQAQERANHYRKEDEKGRTDD